MLAILSRSGPGCRPPRGNSRLRAGAAAAAALLALASLLSPTSTWSAPRAQPASCVQPSSSGCPLEFGQPVQAALANGEDIHTWRVRLAAGRGFHVILSDLPADYDLHLFGPDGTPITESARFGAQEEVVAAPVAEPGEYVVYVDSPLRQTSQTPYTLTATLAQAITSETAPSLVELARWGRGTISNVAFSPDGRWFAVASSLGVYLYDRNLAHVRLLETRYGVGGLAFAPDGQTVVSGSIDGKLQLWRVADGALLWTVDGNTIYMLGVAFAPDGQTLASGSGDKTVRLWRAADGAPLRTLAGHTGLVTSVSFAPDGQTLASGSGDKTVRLWRAADGAPLRSLAGHTNWVLSVAFAPDGLTLASGSGDGTVRLWGVR